MVAIEKASPLPGHDFNQIFDNVLAEPTRSMLGQRGRNLWRPMTKIQVGWPIEYQNTLDS